MTNWESEAKDMLADCRYVPLRILIFGPGDPGSGASKTNQKAYDKRVQIKEELKKRFPRSEVHFPEDEEMIQISKTITGQLKKEALQANIADLILCLDISRGSNLELDHFIPTYPWFGEKVHIFLPEKYVNSTGIVKDVIDKISPDQIEGFTTKEFNECTLATVKAVQVAEGFAMEKKLKN